MKTAIITEKEEILSQIRGFEGLETSLVMIRDSVEMGNLEDEELYPLDTFRYDPECISTLLKETRDCIKSLAKNINTLQ